MNGQSRSAEVTEWSTREMCGHLHFDNVHFQFEQGFVDDDVLLELQHDGRKLIRL